MSVQIFSLLILTVVGLLSVYVWRVSTVEPPLEDYRPCEKENDDQEPIAATG